MVAAPPAQTVVISFETGLHCCTLPHFMLSEAIGSARSGPSKPLCRTSHFKPLDKKHGTTCCASHQHAVCSMQMMFGKKTCSCKLRERDNLRLPDMGKTLTPRMRPSRTCRIVGMQLVKQPGPLAMRQYMVTANMAQNLHLQAPCKQHVTYCACCCRRCMALGRAAKALNLCPTPAITLQQWPDAQGPAQYLAGLCKCAIQCSRSSRICCIFARSCQTCAPTPSITPGSHIDPMHVVRHSTCRTVHMQLSMQLKET